MSHAVKRTQARVHGRNLELIEDLALPPNQVVSVIVEIPGGASRTAITQALDESAGAWSDDTHPDLRSVEDVVQAVRNLRAGFGRSNG